MADVRMIELKDITITYKVGFIPQPVEILKGISFTVERGEVFGYLGPNGAGKTTTIKMLMNLIHADKGTARINGIDVSLPAARRSVGFLPEQPFYYDYLTGRELLGYCAGLFKIPDSKRREKVEELLEKVKLGDKKDTPLYKYSRGMLQRIGVAQALINDPEVLILDEPLSGLDPQGRRDVLEIIIEQKHRGKTIFFSSHILADAETFCDKVGIINHGRIVAQGEINKILAEESGPASVVITFSAGEEGNWQEFERFGTVEQLQARKSRLKVASEKNVDTVLRLMLDRNITILSVNRHKVSLEELYLTKIQ